MKTQDIMQRLAAKHPGEAEYLQAVQEVLESIEQVYNQHPEFENPIVSSLSVSHGWMIGERFKPTLVIVYNSIRLLDHTRGDCVSIGQ